MNRKTFVDYFLAFCPERFRMLAIERVGDRTPSRTGLISLAGVGIGTLYRQFPSRDASIGDVYRNETEQLAKAAIELAESLPPKEALRQWMAVFVEYMARLWLRRATRVDVIPAADDGPLPAPCQGSSCLRDRDCA